MDEEAIYRELENKFLSTFIGELIPGVLHNFANPLNGIMGRSKLLQKRLEEYVKKMEACVPGLSQDFGVEKIIKDAQIIAEESDRFLNLFRDLSDKFLFLSCREPTIIDLSQLLEAEMRFVDFYLDIKHDVKKSVQLDRNLPGINGSTAHFSLCLSCLLLAAKERLKNSPVKEVALRTGRDGDQVFLIMEDSGEEIAGIREQSSGMVADDIDCSTLPRATRSLYYALSLLSHYGAEVRLERRGGHNVMSLRWEVRKSLDTMR